MKLAVTGAAGRMGRALIKAIHLSQGCTLAAALEREGAPELGQDAGSLAGLGELGVAVRDDALEVFADIDGVIDFTAPAASVRFAGLAAQARIVHVIGTTGFGPEHEPKIEAAARHATIVKAGNMSLGVNLLAALTRRVAEALDEDFDIEIVEMHHRHKVDAPSGTALMLGNAAAQGRGIDLKSNSTMSRVGQTGARPTGNIGFATLRGGSVIGEHQVIFAGEGERIQLSHMAEDRSLFTRGAVKAALWAHGKAPGLYDMQDVLGL